MRRLRELERQESRVLGAVRFVDATTGAPLDGPLAVEATGAVLVRNRSGLYTIWRWEVLPAHEAAFEAPPSAPAPASQSLTLRVSDPTDRYLPIVTAVRLPRDPDPAQAETPDSLFQPIRVALYPSTSAPVGVNWAVVRVSLREAGSGDALGGARLRVMANGTLRGRGLSDWRGEALVPIVGVPVTTFSEDADAVVLSEIKVNLHAAFDPNSGTRTPADQVRAGRPPAVLPVVDPDALDTAFDTLPRTQLAMTIAARRSEIRSLVIALP